ncbi:MAG: hypothetical protein K9K88_14725 [Desulfobacterales bacterium]|nr:hypothetical protein [Desulfobacterales bacterium]
MVEFECRMINGEGGLSWIRWIVQVLFDEKGALSEIQAIGRDTSEQKAAEKALRSAHLELASKNQDLNNAYSELYEYSEAISQDLNGVIRAVSNYTEFLYEEYEGSGTGLAMVSKAVSQMGGSVRLESTPGQGSTFFVDLPLSKIHSTESLNESEAN